ncbi:AzlD domain-containing protein [Alkalilacustris brevis]|uniref:AzlD domain-containing protein n=1 Tax=Alkalilacustris brevis TaxID=2026338 RepID=UPI000E0D04BC|nr:AzlD domain-containing protein [Alkalilacustris brevis]
MSYSTPHIWSIIILLGIGSFLIRFSFLGLVGGRKLPDWALRLLRYTPVAVLPGLTAPLVLFPAATGGSPDGPRMAATIVTLVVGLTTRNVLAAILSGAGTLAIGLWLFG